MASAPIFPSVSNLNFRELHIATSTVEDTIAWLRQHGLLATDRLCYVCGNVCNQIRDSKRKDGCRWRCQKSDCRRDVSIRDGSFFGSDSRLELKQVLDFLYLYAYEQASTASLMRECRMASEAIVNWRNYVRDIFAEYFIRNPLPIGGTGHTVEIDESAFVRRKGKVGRMVNTQWVFGGIDVETKHGFLVAVPQRDAVTLLPILQQYVLPGTTVISDLWAAYNTIGNMEYQHLTVNHGIHFVDSQTHATTDHVEGSMWSRAKQRSRRKCGTSRTQLDSNLIEFMWRQQFRCDPFETLLTHIRDVYPFLGPEFMICKYFPFLKYYFYN